MRPSVAIEAPDDRGERAAVLLQEPITFRVEVPQSDPAVLGFLGTNIDRLGLPHRNHALDHSRTIWARWCRLGFGDAGNRPTSDTTRRAYDLLAEGFGPGFNGPLILAAEKPDEDAAHRLDVLVDDIASTAGVAAVTDPIRNQGGTAAVVQVIPKNAPLDRTPPSWFTACVRT